MDKNRVNAIIREEIDRIINEDWMGEKSSKPTHSELVSKYFPHHKDKKKKKSKKIRKLSNGRETYYDYDDYERSNGKTSAGDSSTIRNTIDTEKTNIAAVARDLFPDHTEEGAQSQLRKILNGERPMTKKIAAKIEKMISGGQVATK